MAAPHQALDPGMIRKFWELVRDSPKELPDHIVQYRQALSTLAERELERLPPAQYPPGPNRDKMEKEMTEKNVGEGRSNAQSPLSQRYRYLTPAVTPGAFVSVICIVVVAAAASLVVFRLGGNPTVTAVTAAVVLVGLIGGVWYIFAKSSRETKHADVERGKALDSIP